MPSPPETPKKSLDEQPPPLSCIYTQKNLLFIYREGKNFRRLAASNPNLGAGPVYMDGIEYRLEQVLHKSKQKHNHSVG